MTSPARIVRQRFALLPLRSVGRSAIHIIGRTRRANATGFFAPHGNSAITAFNAVISLWIIPSMDIDI